MTSENCKIVTGVALILEKENKILLFKRNIIGKIEYGNFALPGGTVEINETVKQAACREAFEEIGIIIEEKDLSIVHMFRLRQKYDKKTDQTTMILMLFFAKVFSWKNEPKNLEPEKHSDLGWFSMDNLPKNISTLNLQALHDIRDGIFYNEHGWK